MLVPYLSRIGIVLVIEESYLLLGLVSSTSRSKWCGERIMAEGGETVEELY